MDEHTSPETIDMTEACAIRFDPKTGKLVVSCDPDALAEIVARAHQAGVEHGRAEAAAAPAAPEAEATPEAQAPVEVPQQ